MANEIVTNETDEETIEAYERGRLWAACCVTVYQLLAFAEHCHELDLTDETLDEDELRFFVGWLTATKGEAYQWIEDNLMLDTLEECYADILSVDMADFIAGVLTELEMLSSQLAVWRTKHVNQARSFYSL